MKPVPLYLLPLCLALAACAQVDAPADRTVATPASWQFAQSTQPQNDARQWWRQFASPTLERLIEQAQAGNHDLAAATARIRQAQAVATVAGAALLPEVTWGANVGREHLLRGDGYGQLNAYGDHRIYNTYDGALSASYEVDFWGGNRAARASALKGVEASQYDRAVVQLSVLGGVAEAYLKAMALDEQVRIAALNLKNAQRVQALVRSRADAGSASALELAQQNGLVAAQQRQVPLLRQQADEAMLSLATLLGRPIQGLTLGSEAFAELTWPSLGAGVPSELLRRRPDIAAAEAKLAAAEADVQVARAAMLPKLNLTASFGTGAEHLSETLRNPFYRLAAGLVGPVFDHGRLDAKREQARAKREELLEDYRGSIVQAFADVEKALVGIRYLDQQRQWQEEELQQAQRAFDLAQNRYQAGAEDLLTVLETQRTLYAAQDLQVQLRLSRLTASVGLYKALGGTWQ